MFDTGIRMLQLKQEGYCCTQIMLIMALEAQDKTSPELIRAAQGLCYGVGMSGEVCGALSGGACLISLYGGKGGADEEMDEQLPVMLTELSEWFREGMAATYGGMRCDDILAAHPDKRACGPIVAATYAKALEILESHGIDPTRGRDE